jgi:bla regulator protein blaR1
MHFPFTLSGEEFIQALTWTLLHSLWQGMLLAMIAVCIIFVTKKTTASVRYNLLTVAILIFLTAMAVTFNGQLVKAKLVLHTVQPMPVSETAANEKVVTIPDSNHELSITEKVTLFVAANANRIIFIWLLVIGFQFIRLAAGLYNVHRIRSTQIFSAGDYWNNRIQDLGNRLHISKPVKLLQSGIAKMPMVTGFIKPVILFPAAMLASLPANEVEAILMHELAHIRRKDFLVNLLQSIIEIIFFFNPAVLWVSSLIKTERENCCDDIAVQYTENKQNYIQALLAFQQFNLPVGTSLAPAFAGEKKHLLNRVKRIIYNNNKTLNNMEKKFLAAGIILMSICIFAFSSGNAQNTVTKKKTAEKTASTSVPDLADEKNDTASPTTKHIPANASDTENVFSGRINTVLNGNKYIIVSKNNQIIELYVNGKKIANEKISDYRSITDQLLMQAKKDMEQSRKDMAQSKTDMEQSVKDMEQSKKDMAQSKIDMEQSRKDMEQSRKDMAQSKIDMEQSRKDMEQSRKDMRQAKIDEEQSSILQKNIVADFINEHIINDKKELFSYTLNNNELIVNGIKQSDAVHKKIKDKYVKGDKWTTIYSRNEVHNK